MRGNDIAWRKRWGDRSQNAEDTKSPFDPCPEGWRVPSGVGGTAVDSSPWAGLTNSNTIWRTNAGAYLGKDKSGNGIPASWFPATGYRDGRYQFNGLLELTGAHLNYWGTTIEPSNNRPFRFNKGASDTNPWIYAYAASSYAVRCVREIVYR